MANDEGEADLRVCLALFQRVHRQRQRRHRGQDPPHPGGLCAGPPAGHRREQEHHPSYPPNPNNTKTGAALSCAGFHTKCFLTLQPRPAGLLCYRYEKFPYAVALAKETAPHLRNLFEGRQTSALSRTEASRCLGQVPDQRSRAHKRLSRRTLKIQSYP